MTTKNNSWRKTMKKWLKIIMGMAGSGLFVVPQNWAAENAKTTGEGAWASTPGTYAVFETTLGKIVCKLLTESAPKTVENFTGLAEGTKSFTDMKTNKPAKKKFYDGLIFHRVIPDFMIQGGDPLGSGMGGPGYKFEDEIDPSQNFDSPGVLAMANAGKNTNGSQFFITVAPAGYLKGNYSIFGKVVEGQSVADAISLVERDGRDRPTTPVEMKAVKIVRVK
jgi:peptidyl-prolyl cis-trans isomerase A (cyclophilin A)